MKRKIILLILIFFIVFLAIFFQKYLLNGIQDNNVKRELTYEEINIGCLPGLSESKVRFVVRNQDEYDALLVEYFEKTKEQYKKLWGVTTDEELNKGLPFKNCDAKLTRIDFKRYTLLSHYAEGFGCTVEFNKDLQIDNLNKKVIFTINVTENGSCEFGRGIRESILIPKIPDDYIVDFKTT